MSRPQKHIPGLAELRTRSGLGSENVAPHTAYMKITSLELEKLRLSRVRQNAMRRVAEIDARYLQIEAEKAALMAAATATAETPEGPQPAQRAKGFRVRRTSGMSLRY